MDSDYNVGFYNQYNLLVVELDHAMEVKIFGTYLICSDANNSVKFFVNTISLISGPTFSQSYSPLNVGFYQQDSAYFARLNEIKTYIETNVVKVLFRDIDALIFSDGSVQTTAATGGGGGGTVTSVGFTAGTGITIGGTNPITTSGTVTITNNAPDQTVVLTEGSGIDITGTYPNFTIASTITGGIPKGTAAGTDTYTTTITGVTAYNDGDAYLIRFTNGNTTVATLNINGLGAVDLYRNNDGTLIGGDIVDGAEMLCVYNLTTNRFQVIGTAPNSLIAYVTNADSVTITKGQAVYAFGGQGDRLTVKLAYNTGDSTSAQTIGLVLSTSIGVNQKGLIMMQGLLDGLSIVPTSTWADGDPVYLGSTAGTITKTKPYAPNHLVYLGFVTTANNGSAGRIYVKVQNGYELDELHNVQAQSPSLKDTLYYDNTVSPAQWKTASIATILGYTPANDANVVHTTGNESIAGVKTFSDNQIISTSSTSSALRITQTGTGEALRIEDSTNPDSTPVVVTADGWVGVGISNPDSILHVHNASAGTVTPISGSVMTLENNTTCYFTTLAPDANISGFVMGSPSDNFGAFIRWGHTSGKLEIATANSNDYIEFYVQNAVSKAFITTNGLGVNAQPVASAALQVDSTTQGVLVPRMTTTQRNAIVSPATGLMVYDTTLSSFYFYNGSSWASIGGGSGTVTSIATTSPILGGTITTSGTISIQQADASKDGYISVTDWNTFNNKQNAITLTTTGTSGAATLVGSTLNIPQYTSVGSGASMLYSNVQSGTSITAGSTVYGGFINGAYQTLANEYLRIIPLPKNTIVSNFTVYALAQPATGSSVYTVRKNSVDTALVITIPAGSAAAFHTNTVTTVSFNALDYISVKAVNNASSSVQPVSLSIICTI
jgi:hypothetical protein